MPNFLSILDFCYIDYSKDLVIKLQMPISQKLDVIGKS